MAIIFETTNPSTLLSTFKKAIDDRKVVTWAYDSDGDFVHTPQQWSQVGWLRPRIQQGRLVFGFLARPNQKCTSEGYAVYHGRFIESMLAHCDALFSEAKATALVNVSLGDNISSAA